MSDAAVFDPATARWLVQLGKRLENSQVLNPGYIEQLALKTMPRFSGGGDIAHVYPPASGIPAATWNSTTKKLTPGQAACKLSQKVSGVYEQLTETVLVENPVTVVVGANGKLVTIGRNNTGAWTVLVEDCSGTTTTTTTGGSTGTGSGLGGTGTAI
jgi:hypothetical protein